MSILERAKEEQVPMWTCPDCGTTYFGITGKPQFCPACRAKRDERVQEYWNKERVGMRSITDDIVAKALAGAK